MMGEPPLSERLPWQSWNRSGQRDDFMGAWATRRKKEGNDAMNDKMIEAMSQCEIPHPIRRLECP
jgi:hypothetical protein